MIVVDFFVPWHVCLPFECSFQRALKFEGPLEINSNLSRAKRLFEGQIVGPESIAIDSTGTCKLKHSYFWPGGNGRQREGWGWRYVYSWRKFNMRCAGCIHSETLTLFPISDQNNHVIFLSLFQTWNYCCSHNNYKKHSVPFQTQQIPERTKPCQISHSVLEQNNWELKNQCPSKGLHIPILLVIAFPVIGWGLK